MRPHSRRAFLAGAGLAGAALAGDPEGYWRGIRREFEFPEERVPLNAANLCPSPRRVTACLEQFTHEIDRDCSLENRRKFAARLEQTRARLARQIGAGADEVAIVRNTTEANNIINNGLPLRPGDEVVVWDENHPTNNVAWEVRAARFGFTVRRVSTPRRPAGPEELASVFERALSGRTRVLAVTHVSNVTGVRLPVPWLAEIARRRGIYLHVDGAQTWGALRVNVSELGCDSYSASAHKWFMGPREAGILYVRADRIPQIWPNSVAPGWGDDAETDLQGARKFESLGQRDDARLVALDAAAEFLDGIGWERLQARVLELARRLKEGLVEAGARLVTPMDEVLSAGVCVMEVPAPVRQALVAEFYANYGLAVAANGGLRLCPHVYNTREHLERAVRAVRNTRSLWNA